MSQKKLVALATKILGNKADAQDVVQDVLLKAYQKGQSDSFPWLYKATKDASRDVLRKSVRRRHEPEEEGHKVAAEDASWLRVQIPRTKDTSVLVAKVNGALREVPSIRRGALLLYGQGLDHKEIAKKLGVEPSTVNGRLQVGREELTGALCTKGVIVGAKCLKAKLK